MKEKIYCILLVIAWAWIIIYNILGHEVSVANAINFIVSQIVVYLLLLTIDKQIDKEVDKAISKHFKQNERKDDAD